MNIYTIYLIKCAINSKVYIGYTSKSAFERFNQHIRSSRKPNTKFHRAIRKHTPSNFSIEELYVTHDRQHAGEVENEMIMLYDSIAKGYNTARGGQGGCISLFKENPDYNRICQKMSNTRKKNADFYRTLAHNRHQQESLGMYGRMHTQETKDAIGRTHKGKHISDYQKHKQREALYKTFTDPEYTHPNTGKARSEDVKLKISLARQQLPKRSCPHCHNCFDPANYAKYHGDKCKQRELEIA